MQKDIFVRADGVFLVVRGAICSPEDPNGSLVTGLAKAARSEIGGTPIITLDLNAQNPLAEDAAADTIFSLFNVHFVLKRNRGPNLDVEYAEINGVLMIPRIVENTH